MRRGRLAQTPFLALYSLHGTRQVRALRDDDSGTHRAVALVALKQSVRGASACGEGHHVVDFGPNANAIPDRVVVVRGHQRQHLVARIEL